MCWVGTFLNYLRAQLHTCFCETRFYVRHQTVLRLLQERTAYLSYYNPSFVPISSLASHVRIIWRFQGDVHTRTGRFPLSQIRQLSAQLSLTMVSSRGVNVWIILARTNWHRFYSINRSWTHRMRFCMTSSTPLLTDRALLRDVLFAFTRHKMCNSQVAARFLSHYFPFRNALERGWKNSRPDDGSKLWNQGTMWSQGTMIQVQWQMFRRKKTLGTCQIGVVWFIMGYKQGDFNVVHVLHLVISEVGTKILTPYFVIQKNWTDVYRNELKVCWQRKNFIWNS